MGVSRFRVKLITRNQTLLDCMVHSLNVPAVDGQLGIMRSHYPTVCELGLGILTAKKLRSLDDEDLGDKYFLIDGGFIQVVENNALILAYDLATFDDLAMDEVDKMLDNAEKILAADAYSKQTRRHEVEKAALIRQLAQQVKIRD